jgi:hypothetical protein
MNTSDLQAGCSSSESLRSKWTSMETSTPPSTLSQPWLIAWQVVNNFSPNTAHNPWLGSIAELSQPASLLMGAVAHRCSLLCSLAFHSASCARAATKPEQWVSHPAHNHQPSLPKPHMRERHMMGIIQTFTKQHPNAMLGTTLEWCKVW